jgi:hypothetical protein
MDKAELLNLVLTERANWEAALSEVGEDRMAEPGVDGDWSVKDIVAHITWSEREMVGVLQARALVGSDLWDLSNDERNAIVYQQNRGRALADVLAEAQDVYRQLMAALESLSDEDLNDPSRFADMPADWEPWRVIAGNTYLHYTDHAESIRAWLDQTIHP